MVRADQPVTGKSRLKLQVGAYASLVCAFPMQAQLWTAKWEVNYDPEFELSQIVVVN